MQAFADSLIEFELRVPRPAPGCSLLAHVLEALSAEGAKLPVRWAIVAVEHDMLVIGGARLCSS